MSNEIFEYIHRKNGGRWNKIGVMVGRKCEDNIIRIGWSKCNFKVGDRFDRGEGMELAKERLIGVANTPPVPNGDVRQMRAFAGRCIKYFRDAKGIELAKQE